LLKIYLKLPAHRAGLPEHASGGHNVSKGSFVHIVPLDPAYPALGEKGHVSVKLFETAFSHRGKRRIS
jgi:hypothetical protein